MNRWVGEMDRVADVGIIEPYGKCWHHKRRGANLEDIWRQPAVDRDCIVETEGYLMTFPVLLVEEDLRIIQTE